MFSSKQFVSAVIISILFLGLVTSESTYARRSTTQESFTDPDYKNYRPKNVVLIVISEDTEVRLEIEKRMTKVLAENGLTVARHVELFPPTREWTAEAQMEIYAREKIEAELIITVGASSASIIPMATQTHSSSNAYGSYNSGNFNTTGSGSSTSYNLVKANSNASFSAVLLDVNANRVAWYSDIFTKAQGTMYVGAKGDAKAVAKAVSEGLTENGHIIKEK